jgi:hypothetical protein
LGQRDKAAEKRTKSMLVTEAANIGAENEAQDSKFLNLKVEAFDHFRLPGKPRLNFSARKLSSGKSRWS